MNVNKGTHEGYRTEMFMPIMKQAEGKYIAVLSDTSLDRDDESISRGCIEKIGSDDNYLAALLNHDNDILNLVAEWTNKKVVEIDGHTAFVAEPKFYLSNPKAKVIKGMLDEGAKPGISIGAIVKDYDEVNGKRVFTDLEIIEASFVGIPSNRHGRAMAVAKSFSKTNLEASKMEKQFTQKDVDTALEKKAEEMKVDLEKQMKTKDAEVADLNKKLEDSEKSVAEAKKSVEDANVKIAEAAKEAEKSAAEAEVAKKVALEKQRIADETNDSKEGQLDIDKNFADGKIPIGYMRG